MYIYIVRLPKQSKNDQRYFKKFNSTDAFIAVGAAISPGPTAAWLVAVRRERLWEQTLALVQQQRGLWQFGESVCGSSH